jgi:GNAT superfamily N-acetyltransferase
MPEFELHGHTPGVIGEITALHATYYHEHWNFDLYFEAKVASELSAFLTRFDPAHDGFWVATADGGVVGAIAVEGGGAGTEGARLRWFIVAPEYHGGGLGNRLMQEALGFCARTGFRRVYLTTFAGLDAARHLYEKNGFTLIAEQEDSTWGTPVIEQTFELLL